MEPWDVSFPWLTIATAIVIVSAEIKELQCANQPLLEDIGQ